MVCQQRAWVGVVRLLLLTFCLGLPVLRPEAAEAANTESQPLELDLSCRCSASGSEDWPSVQRRLLRLLDGQGNPAPLAPELDRVLEHIVQREVNRREAPADPPSLVVGCSEPPDCVPGRIALHLLLLLTQPAGSGASELADSWQEGGLLDADWRLLGILGWPRVVRSGWPIFRLLRLLTRKAEAEVEAEPLADCGEDDNPFALVLLQHIRRREQGGEALLAASAAFLADQVGQGRCPLSTAAAFLASAWVRFPVFDDETE
ncbi:unnamed protein product, partial [Polarella glacialis]